MKRRSDLGWLLPRLEERSARYLQTGEWRRQLISDVAAAQLKEGAERIIVTDERAELTREQLFDLAVRLGSALHRRGLRQGDVVGFQLPNWHEACVVATACALFGYVLSPMLLMYRERELGFILSETGCRAFFRPGEFRGYDYRALLSRVLPNVPQEIDVFGVRDAASATSAYETLISSDEANVPLPDVDPASVKTVVFTSGTTGRPKGVLHSHFTAHATVRRAIGFWHLEAADKLLVPSPVGHIGGSIYAFEIPWFAGASVRLMDSWNAQRAVELIDKDSLTFCAGATPFLQGILDCAQETGSSLPSLRRFICGGAAVPPALVEAANECFENAVVSRAYGSTEVPLVCPGVRTRADAHYGQTTDGQIDAEVRIVDQTDRLLPDGTDGDIIVKSPSAFVAYLDSDDEDGQFTQDGYFRMGDIGHIVDASFLKITGRRKEIIIRLGENISAAEIENTLAHCAAVKRVAVIGIPNARTGERAVAFIELEAGHELTFKGMQQFLLDCGLAKQKLPEDLHVLDELPTNSIGKVMKLELKDLAEKMARR